MTTEVYLRIRQSRKKKKPFIKKDPKKPDSIKYQEAYKD